MVGLAPKWVRLASNGTNPGFVPFGANLTHFGAKPTIHGKTNERKHVCPCGRELKRCEAGEANYSIDVSEYPAD